MTDASGASTFRVPADAYDRFMGRFSTPLAPEFIAAVGVRAGDTALDVGCGPGALTAALVDLLGAEKVAAIDPSPPFAEACRARHPGVRVEVTPAESLPFDDNAFDAALAQLVVAFMSDAPAAVREMKRVVRPGGRVAAAMWDDEGGMQLLRFVWDAANTVRPSAERDTEPVRYRKEAELLELWRGAGLADASTTAAVVESGYSGIDELWSSCETGVGPVGAFVARLDADEREAMKEELRRRVGDGPFTLSGRAWIVTGAA